MYRQKHAGSRTLKHSNSLRSRSGGLQRNYQQTPDGEIPRGFVVSGGCRNPAPTLSALQHLHRPRRQGRWGHGRSGVSGVRPLLSRHPGTARCGQLGHMEQAMRLPPLTTEQIRRLDPKFRSREEIAAALRRDELPGGGTEGAFRRARAARERVRFHRLEQKYAPREGREGQQRTTTVQTPLTTAGVREQTNSAEACILRPLERQSKRAQTSTPLTR